ncbi:MAG: hypothetical protein E6Q69_14980 [Aquipseudomonas alcaligenes]|uniref:Uncharacterized protein n=1 Tax=Aquipseudomonas alcaligenes TaxID=43263 RepID=A0A5C7VUK6_AQUAC|nr:MAG: hypothetical protein E6Q69_14980 [Pseudomonas alcaligenes]
MVIHLTIDGKRTSTTLDDLLLEFMMVRFGGLYMLSKKTCRPRLQKWLQKKINHMGGSISGMKPSEWAKATILREIVNPNLVEQFDKMRPGWSGTDLHL